MATNVSVKRKRVQVSGFEPTLTQQQFKDECDINNIIKKYTRNGVNPFQLTEGEYQDFTDVPSFHEAMSIIAEAQQSFDILPAAVRKRFQNDPAQFLEFVHDKNNLPEMHKLGLLRPDYIAVQNEQTEQNVTRKGHEEPSPT